MHATITHLAPVDFALAESEEAMIHHQAIKRIVKNSSLKTEIFFKEVLGEMAEANILRELVNQPEFDVQ